jgi:hypothetical protein
MASSKFLFLKVITVLSPPMMYIFFGGDNTLLVSVLSVFLPISNIAAFNLLDSTDALIEFA